MDKIVFIYKRVFHKVTHSFWYFVSFCRFTEVDINGQNRQKYIRNFIVYHCFSPLSIILDHY